MRSLTVLSLLSSVCVLVQLAHAQKPMCDLDGSKRDVAFPDIEKMAAESFEMSVEFTLPDARQTDFYVEYYDISERRGRVDAHRAGKSESYIYLTESEEAWRLVGRNCTLENLNETTPALMKGDQSEWLYVTNQDDRRVFGPSGMFKYALDVWNSSSRVSKMAYMGKANFRVRGLETQFWRRCDSEDTDSYIDYFFTTDDESDPIGADLKNVPLRVYFGGKRSGKEPQMSVQQYDIVKFQPFISLGVEPFQLPKGRGCRRGPLHVPPPIPDFMDKNLMFNAEVVYRKVDYSEEDVQLYSYYSTLRMALDLSSQHLAYYYTPWNTTKSEKDEPIAGSPEYIIFDMKHGYAYKTNIETGKCDIDREKSFVPKYSLPNDAGAVSLTDPSILFPNSELTFLSEGINRGLKVNVFEEIVGNYQLDKNDKTVLIPKAIISHSYLKNEEIETGVVEVKNALTQVQLRLMGRQPKVMELLTFNFYRFNTQLIDRRSIFNVLKCYKNDDDYAMVTIGFNADKSVLETIKDEVPEIQANILSSITLQSELNPVRIPYVLVDINDGIFVTMVILGKPPIMLDYLKPEEGKTITGSTEVEGVQDPLTCALKCLETEDNCWGFSMCGAVCTFGATDSAKVGKGDKCQLYRRYDNTTYIPSKEKMVENLRREVQNYQVTLVLNGKDDKMVQIQASSFEVTYPGEDDRIFDRTGNEVNTRLRVVKAGAKLTSSAGHAVKNLGRLRFDECQRLCLDFQDCESVSYCLKDSECIISTKHGDELTAANMEDNNMCSILSRKYADNFDRSPGNVLSLTAKEVVAVDSAEKCAMACMKNKKFTCLSFDHCPQDTKTGCKLHTVHYPTSKTREDVQTNNTNCGHYFRKYSTEFKKSLNLRYVGSSLAPISNMTLEQCSKACVEFGKGSCYGFDFCQDVTMFATSCILLDKDPSTIKTSYSDVCVNYLRASEVQTSKRPYTTGYAGGIGFLCFLIGLVVGAVVVFAIAYFRVNRR